MIIDRLAALRDLIARSSVSVASTFSYMRESNFPPQFLRDFEYIKVDPCITRDALVGYYFGKEKDHLWEHVATEHGITMKQYTGQQMNSKHNLALRLVLSVIS